MGKLTFGQTGLSYEVDRVEINSQGAPKCLKCDQRVYFNEEKKAGSKSWHIRCFSCYRCKKSLASTNYNLLNDELLCPACYKKENTLKPSSGAAYVPGYGGTSPSIVPDDRFGEPGPSRLGQQEVWVSHGDSKRSSGASSQECYVEVDKGDTRNISYTETWVNNSGGSAYSSPSVGSREDLNRAEWASPRRTEGPITRQMLAPETTSYRIRAASARDDPTLSVQGFTAVGGDLEDSRSSTSEESRELKRWTSNGAGGLMRSDLGAKASAKFRQSTTTVDKSDPECCPHCGKRVYFAEEIKVMKRKWHKLCFKCGSCSKSLEPGKFTEHESGLYCQTCYGKHYGPHGYGFAGGAAGRLSAPAPSPGISCINGGTTLGTFDYTASSLPRGGSTLGRGSIGQPFSPGISNGEIDSTPVTLHVTQPIRGAQEWTEAIYLP